MRNNMIAILLLCNMFSFLTISFSLKVPLGYKPKDAVEQQSPYIYIDTSDDVDTSQTKTNKELNQKDRTFIPEVPDVCKNERFCNKVSNYPEEHAEKLLRELISKMKNATHVSSSVPRHNIELEQAKSGVVPLCETQLAHLKPLTVRNDEGEWVFVLNPKKVLLQSFKYQLCRYLNVHAVHWKDKGTASMTNRTCDKGLVYFMAAYEGYCFQNYINVLMYTLDRDTGDLQQSWHPIPSGCSCEAVALDHK